MRHEWFNAMKPQSSVETFISGQALFLPWSKEADFHKINPKNHKNMIYASKDSVHNTQLE
jgi:hypothetical protein